MKQVYRHYKGGLYEFIAFGKSEATGTDMAVYKSLQDGEVYMRPVEEWNEKFFPESTDNYLTKLEDGRVVMKYPDNYKIGESKEESCQKCYTASLLKPLETGGICSDCRFKKFY